MTGERNGRLPDGSKLGCVVHSSCENRRWTVGHRPLNNRTPPFSSGYGEGPDWRSRSHSGPLHCNRPYDLPTGRTLGALKSILFLRMFIHRKQTHHFEVMKSVGKWLCTKLDNICRPSQTDQDGFCWRSSRENSLGRNRRPTTSQQTNTIGRSPRRCRCLRWTTSPRVGVD